MNRALQAFFCAGLLDWATLAGATAQRDPPTVSNSGGLSKSLRPVAIIPNDSTDASDIGDFIRSVPKSHWCVRGRAAKD